MNYFNRHFYLWGSGSAATISVVSDLDEMGNQSVAANSGSVFGESFFVIMAVIIAALTLLATVAILVPSIMAIIQARRIERELEKFEKKAEDVDRILYSLKESVKDYMHPTAILMEAKAGSERLLEDAREAIASHISSLEDRSRNHEKKTDDGLESLKGDLQGLVESFGSQIERIDIAMNNINDRIGAEVSHKGKDGNGDESRTLNQ